MKTGDLVTERTAPDGAPPWVGCVRHAEATGSRRIIYDRLGGPPRFGMMMYDGGSERSVAYCEDIRPLTDDESCAVVAWLLTGDPAAEWDRWDRGWRLAGGDSALWSRDDGAWRVFVVKRRAIESTACTDRARRVAACRAFLAHICQPGGGLSRQRNVIV